MRHQVDSKERPVGDLYITRFGDIAELQYMLTPRGFSLLWDPCASGAAPWTVGAILGDAWGLPFVLTDISPRRDEVFELDYLTAPRPAIDGPIIEVSNPPYGLIKKWLPAWSARARPGDAAVWLCAYDSFPVAGDRKQGECVAICQPRHRLAFQLTLEDAKATGRDTKEGKARPVDGDGLVTMDASGKSHCWLVFQKGRPTRRRHVLGGEAPLIITPEGLED